MMTPEDFLDVLADITGPADRRVRFLADSPRSYIQVSAVRPCAVTGEVRVQRGGKRYLSEHMVPGEFVRLVFDAVMAFEEHELRETFLYRGKRVFGPHISLEALMDAADSIEVRSPA